MSEYLEPVEDDDDHKEDESAPCSVWLPFALEDERVAADALGFERLLEAQVRDQDRDPGKQTRNRGERLEPVEDVVGARRDGHVRQETERRSDEDTPNRNTLLGALEEDFRCLTVLGERKEVAGAGVEEGISGGCGRCQNDGVDDRW